MTATGSGTVRAATDDDVGAVERIARAAWHAAYDDVLGVDEVDRTVDEWYDPDGLRADVAAADPFLVAVVDGVVVGFVGATVDAEEGRVHVDRLYVHPDCWRGGHGRRLLRGLLERLPPPVTSVELEVLAANDVGRSFYRTLGFEVRARRESRVPRHDVTVVELAAPVERVRIRLDGDD